MGPGEFQVHMYSAGGGGMGGRGGSIHFCLRAPAGQPRELSTQ